MEKQIENRGAEQLPFVKAKLPIILFIVIHACMLAWSASFQSPVIDEPVHLSSGIYQWQTGSFELNRGNPPLVGFITAFPAYVMGAEIERDEELNSFSVAQQFVKKSGKRLLTLTTWGRWALIPFSLLGCWICHQWAGELYGARSGIIAGALWVCCPILIANGEIITGDMASASCGLLALFSYWKWFKQPTFGQATLTGVLLGIAELTKFVWVLNYLMWPCAWLLLRGFREPNQSYTGLVRELGQLILIFTMSFYVINLCYLFDGTGSKLSEYQCGRSVIEVFAEDDGSVPESNSSISKLLAGFPVPLPRDYVLGIDEINQFFDLNHIIYVGGKWVNHTPWYYFLYGFIVKLPIGTLILACVAYFLLSKHHKEYCLFDELFLAFTSLSLVMFLTIATEVPYIRYGLPILPLLIVWVSKVGQFVNRTNLRIAVSVSLCLLWSGIETVRIYPHSGSYFNQLAGGAKGGRYHFVLDSFDWGQDLLYFESWLEQHPEVDDLQLAYFGRVDPNVLGIQFQRPPRQQELAQGMELKTGWYAVSVSLVHGFPWSNLHDGSGGEVELSMYDYSYFRYFEPFDSAGYSILIYHLTEEDIAKIRNGITP